MTGESLPVDKSAGALVHNAGAVPAIMNAALLCDRKI